MFDYQVFQSAYMMKNGVNEDAEPDEKTEQEFDDQYKRVAEILKKLPQ